MAEQPDIQELSDRARRYLLAGFILAVLAVTLLLVDVRLKRDVVAKVAEARDIVKNWQVMVYATGQPGPAGPAGDPAGDGVSPDHGVVGDAPPGEVLAEADHHWEAAGDGGRAGGAGGPRGDG